MLGIYECDLTATFLRLCDNMQRQRRLTGGFRPVDLDNSALGHAAYTERGIKCQRAGWDCIDLEIRPVTQTHNRALAEVFLDLPDSSIKSLFLVVIGSLIGCFFLFHRLSSFLFCV